MLSNGLRKILDHHQRQPFLLLFVSVLEVSFLYNVYFKIINTFHSAEILEAEASEIVLKITQESCRKKPKDVSQCQPILEVWALPRAYVSIQRYEYYTTRLCCLGHLAMKFSNYYTHHIGDSKYMATNLLLAVHPL